MSVVQSVSDDTLYNTVQSLNVKSSICISKHNSTPSAIEFVSVKSRGENAHGD